MNYTLVDLTGGTDEDTDADTDELLLGLGEAVPPPLVLLTIAIAPMYIARGLERMCRGL